MNPDRIDLHCHSTASDGRLTPLQLIELAKRNGVRALALTDHDTVAGLRLFQDAGKQHGIETVSGVEISADFAKGTMHMVGLFVDPQCQPLRAFLRQLSDGRKVRNPQIVTKLNELGLAITMQEVEQEAGTLQNAVGGGAIDKSIGRPHIAAVLIKKGYVATKQEAFDKYLAKGRPAYVSRYAASPEDSIAQIRQAGGLAILAHPTYLRAQDDAELEQIIAGLKANGLDGIETYYSTHTPADCSRLCALAKKYDLLESGGSDFHGEAGRGGHAVELGSGLNQSLNMPYAVLDKLKAKSRR